MWSQMLNKKHKKEVTAKILYDAIIPAASL